MESLFPDIFFLSFFAATILRIGLAVAFFHYGGALWSMEGTYQKYLAGGMYLVGALLVIGLFVQLAAIVGIALVFAYWWHSRSREKNIKFHELVLVSTALISLMVLGAGAFALDMPY